MISTSRLENSEEPLVEVYRGEAYIYRRSPPPRARVVYAVERIEEESGAVRRLLDAAFDLRNAAVTADRLDLPSRIELSSNPAEVVGYSDTRVAIKASAAQPALLVMADQYYPGWRARVDGQPTKVHLVNLVQRGVLLPPGEHEVVLEFAPDSLRLGGELSLVGLLAMGGLAGFEAFRRLRHPARECRSREQVAEPRSHPWKPARRARLASRLKWSGLVWYDY